MMCGSLAMRLPRFMHAASVGSLTQSCAQATRPRNASTAVGVHRKGARSEACAQLAAGIGCAAGTRAMAAGRVQCRRPTCLGTSRRAPEGAYGDARLGAALAYYSVFSLGPLIVIAVAIAGLLFGHDAVRGCKLVLHERSAGRSSNVKASH